MKARLNTHRFEFCFTDMTARDVDLFGKVFEEYQHNHKKDEPSEDCEASNFRCDLSAIIVAIRQAQSALARNGGQ